MQKWKYEIMKKMDEILIDKLENIKNLILETILENEKDLIKWKNNKEITFDEKRFNIIFHGDWNRNSNTHLKLNQFINTKNKPIEIFNEIKKELLRNKTNIYKANINPNLFFIFYDKFYELELNSKYKLEFGFLRDNDTDNIIGIHILNREKIENNFILRKEFIRIIEIHSKFLLNENIRNYLGDELFKKIFIKNCIIQKEVQTYYNSRFVDLCYSLDKVILNPYNYDINELYKIEKNNIYIEINEEHHSNDVDIMRSSNLISSSGSKISMFDITNIKDNDGILFYKEILTNICKNLIKNKDIKNSVMKLFLVEVENLDSSYIDFIIDYKYSNKTFTLKDVFNIIKNNNNGENIEIEKIIKILFKRLFFDSETYFQNLYDYNQIQNNGLDFLQKNYKSIKLTRIGIENMFYSIDKKYWKEKDRFTSFKIEIENKYLVSIEKLLEDTTIDILIEENNLKNSIFHILKNFDEEKFRKNVKKIYKYKNLIHNNIPFVIKSSNNFIDIRIIKLFITSELFDELEEKNFFVKGYLVGYRTLFSSEFDEIMNYMDYSKDFELVKI